MSWTPDNGSWSFASDRTVKDRIVAVDAVTISDKIAQLPITEWSYQGCGQRHIGATAQGFHGLFPFSDTDKILNDAGLHGVELVAIKGLNQKLQAELHRRDAENAKLKRQNDSLAQGLNELEVEVQSLAAKK